MSGPANKASIGSLELCFEEEHVEDNEADDVEDKEEEVTGVVFGLHMWASVSFNGAARRY